MAVVFNEFDSFEICSNFAYNVGAVCVSLGVPFSSDRRSNGHTVIFFFGVFGSEVFRTSKGVVAVENDFGLDSIKTCSKDGAVFSGYYCSVVGDEESTEVFIVPRNEFGVWLTQEKNIRKSNNENLPEKAEKES